MLRNLMISTKAARQVSTFSAIMAALLAPMFTSAQALPRITSPVDDSALVTLEGSTHPQAKPQFDRGRVDDSRSGRMILVLKRSPQQEEALRSFIESQHSAASPNFHKWLTPQQFGEKFGTADGDIATVTDYLQTHGFEVGHIYTNKMAIEVTGTAGQLREAFHTEIHTYSIHGRQFSANTKDLRIPSALSPVVAGFAALNNIRATQVNSLSLKTITAAVEPQTHRFKPAYTGKNGTLSYYLVAPADLQTIYDIPPHVIMNGVTTSTLSGAGVKVGVISDAQINLNLVTQYQTLAGLALNSPVEIVDGNDPVDATLSADAITAYEQIELVSAAAQGASINYYTSGTTDYDTGLDFALIRSVQDNAVSVLVMGAQSCEAALGAAGNYFINGEYQQAAAQGISVIAATGDSGSAACDTPGETTSTLGLAVNGYASTPYNTAVGGTDFYYAPLGVANYWGTTNGSSYGSALKPIPEQAWNDSILDVNDDNPDGLTSTVYGGGGGYSTVGLYTTYGTTGTYYPIQSWQSSFVTGSARAIPDVALFAGNNYNSATYALCTQPDDCLLNGTTVTSVTEAGGTAGAAGVFAGIVADLVQKMGARQGNINPTLYALYAAAGVFHDTTVGSNSMDCIAGTGCTLGTLKVGAARAYQAVTGWDAASGLGSVDAAKLIAAWSSLATTATTTALTITAYPGGPAVKNAVHGTGLTFYTRVTPAGGGTVSPTGNVALNTGSSLPSYGSIDSMALINGQGSSSQNIFLPGGSYNVTAYYPGDSTFESSTSPGIPVTITPEPSLTFIYSSNVASGATVAYGAPVSITVEPFSLNGNDVSTPTGTISVFNGGNYPIQSLPISSEGTATYYTTILAQGNYAFTFKYSGDPSYAPSSTAATPFNLKIGIGASVTTLAASSTTGSNTNSILITATVSNAGSALNGVTPTGKVSLNITPGRTLTLTPQLYNSSSQAVAAATYTLLSTQIPAGGLIASYTGDTNYAASTSATLALTRNTTTYASTSAITMLANGVANTATVSANSTLAISVTATQAGGGVGVGTVQLTANSVNLGSIAVTLANGGQGSFTVPFINGYLPLVTGKVSLLATFTPAGGVASPSTSTISLTVTDDRTNADFAVSTDSTTETISPSSSNSYFQVQLTSIANFSVLNFPITLTCTVPGASYLTCIFPDSTNTNQGTMTVSMGSSGILLKSVKISGFPTIVNMTSANPQPLQGKWWYFGGGSTLACLLVFGMPARRKAWQSMLTLLLCASFITTSISGCSTGSSLTQSLANSGTKLPTGSSTPVGTANDAGGIATNLVKPGTYQVLITATATTSNTTLTHNTPVTIVVSSTPTLANGSYAMTNLSSNLLVTDPGASTAPNTNLVQNSADNKTDQQWIFTYQSGGYYTITNAANGLYITDANSTGSYSYATQAAVTGDATQLWAFNLLEGGYEIVNGSTGGVLDDDSFGKTQGTNVIVYPQKDITLGVNQTWYIH